MDKTKRIIILGLMVALALVLSIVESWFPLPLPVPGVKLGLANIITITVIIFYGFKDAISVVFIRCLLGSIFGGGIIGFLFSISGGILSTVIMYILYKKGTKLFSTIGISVAGAVSHNIAQIIMASIIMKDAAIYTILPLLLMSGLVMGLFVGLCSGFLEKAIRNTKLFI